MSAAAGSIRGLLLWLGLIGYALYNYAFYLFGAALNAFFPIYLAALVLSGTVLIVALSHIDARRVARVFVQQPQCGSLAALSSSSDSGWRQCGSRCGPHTSSRAGRRPLNPRRSSWSLHSTCR